MAYVMARTRGMGALNCPGDPGCPGYVAPVMNCPGDPGCPGNPINPLNQIQAEIDALFAYTGAGQSPAGQQPASTFTAWLNANASMVTIGAAVLAALVLFAKAGR